MDSGPKASQNTPKNTPEDFKTQLIETWSAVISKNWNFTLFSKIKIFLKLEENKKIWT